MVLNQLRVIIIGSQGVIDQLYVSWRLGVGSFAIVARLSVNGEVTVTTDFRSSELR